MASNNINLKIDLTNPLYQSPFTYMQAAGSDDANEAAYGIHLRWDFLRTLGDKHLPKGDLAQSGSYATSIEFNRADDFVEIYRVPFTADLTVSVDLNNPPNSLTEDPDRKEWLYTGFTPVAFDPGYTTDVILRFVDIQAYNNARVIHDPNGDPLGFMKAYTGVVEIQTVGKLMYMGIFQLDNIDPAPEPERNFDFKVESVSRHHDKFDLPGTH